MSANYKELKRQAFEANMALPKLGLVAFTFGNVSAIDRKRGVFAIKPSGVPYGELSPDKMVIVDFEGKTVKGLLKEGLDGVILPPPLSDSRTLLDSLHKAALPFVAVATGYPEEECLAVRISDKDAAAAMTRYLISLGHRKIGFILGASNQRASHQRYEGFSTALLDAGIEIRPEWIKKGSFSYRSGLIAAEQILAATDRPSALFASNDDMAAGAVAVAHKLHLEVPGHVSIVGFDDTPLATTIWPTLTTIRQPITAMARKALEMVLREITLRRQGKTLAPCQQFLNFSLIRRESSGPFNSTA